MNKEIKKNKLFSITGNKNGVIIWQDQIEYIKNDYILNHQQKYLLVLSPLEKTKKIKYSLSEINQLGYPNSNFFSN